MWFLLPVIGILKWVSLNHDSTECIRLMKEASQWDGDVASAIQAKASGVVTQSILNASWGWMSTPRGGQCDLNMNDIIAGLLLILLAWVVKTFVTPPTPPPPPTPPTPTPPTPTPTPPTTRIMDERYTPV